MDKDKQYLVLEVDYERRTEQPAGGDRVERREKREYGTGAI